MPERSMGFREVTILIIAETLLSMVIFAAVIGILVFLIRGRVRKYKPIDVGVFDRLQPWVNPSMNKFMLAFTFMGSHKFLIPANLFLIFYFVFARHQNWSSIRIITIALSSLVLMFFLKYLFQRKRPLSPLLKAAKGLSFPSGHAIMSLTFYGLLMHITWNTMEPDWLKWSLCVVLGLVILLIGYSRVYLRVHYASDVLSGFIIGFLWLCISLWVLDNLEEYAKTGF